MSEDTQFDDDDDVLPNDGVEVTAEYPGILKLGDNELPCFVLSNRKRVLIQREVIHLLTGNRKGGLERYTKAVPIRDFMPPKFVNYAHKDVAILFRVGNKLAYGYEASDVIAICDGYLKARQAASNPDSGIRLHPGQEALARQAEIFIRACAKVGLEALIDEATGYQAVRDANELQIKLAAYIAKDLNEWTRTFPEEFFELLYRLEGQKPPDPPKPYPQRFGRYVMQFIYDTLDPDVADWLREHNPNPEGDHHHHQWLTAEFGQPKLKQHLSEVVGIMKASTTMERFKENMNRAYIEAKDRRRKRLQEARRLQQVERLREQGVVQMELEFTYL